MVQKPALSILLVLHAFGDLGILGNFIFMFTKALYF